MARVLIVKNISHEGPGRIQRLLDAHNIPSHVVDLHAGDEFPDPRAYNALIVLGGPDSANDQTPKMLNELDRIRTALDAGIPYLGICLGLQTLVKAVGGKVVRNHIREIGFIGPDSRNFEINLTQEGRLDPLFKGLAPRLPIFHLHGETVSLEGVNDAHLLATGIFCINQIVRVGNNAYGLQGHLELTSELFEEWLNLDPDLKAMDQELLRREYSRIKDGYDAFAKQLFENFIGLAKLE